MTIRACLLLCAGILSSAATLLAQTDSPPCYKVISGDVVDQKGELLVKGRSAVVSLGGDKNSLYQVTAELQLAPSAAKGSETSIVLLPTDVRDVNKRGLLRLTIGRDKAGLSLKLLPSSYDGTGKKPWVSFNDPVVYTYWPADKGKKDKSAPLVKAGVDRRSWRDRWLSVRVEVGPKSIIVWFDGEFVRQIPRPQEMQGPVAMQLTQGDRLRAITMTVLADTSLFMPIDLDSLANDHFAKPIGKRDMEFGGVAFVLPQGKNDHLSLRHAQWTTWKQDLPWSHENAVPAMRHDPRMLMLRVPVADYVAAHVLAVADDDPGLAAAFTLRAGRYGKTGNEQDVQYDFYSPVPRRSQVKDIEPGRVLQTPDGPLFHVRVPMDTAIAQDIIKYLEIELTKEVRLARRSPDPNRFRYRPLGLPSGVRIAALTLERSPLQLHVGSTEIGHAFVEPQQPAFQVKLSNITLKPQPFTLGLEATHLDGAVSRVERSGSVDAGATTELSIAVPAQKRGYHELKVSLAGAGNKTLLQRRTSFALLPPDTRKHRDQSPFGTYSFGGSHYTSNDPDQMGPLYVKLGMRYGMFQAPAVIRRKYGVLKGNEPNILKGLGAYEKALAQDPQLPPAVLLFHESAISGKQITRTPDLFHDRPAYKLDEKEEQHFKNMWDQALTAGTAMRAKYPHVHIRFGNDAHPTKEEFYRRKFPGELFDSAGNETPAFGSFPEAQPPDFITGNASLWMDRQLLDAYGYKDKAVTMCHEVCYPSTNPGNLDLETQADYLVRHALHALAWEIPEFRPGILTDVGGNYRMSHWGSSGFCRAKPEYNVKPAFVAFATMTLMLDGARFVRVVPTKSASLYVLEFNRPDGGQVYALWTVRGQRSVKLRQENIAPWKLVDGQANEAAAKATGKDLELTVSGAAVYLSGKGRLTFVEAGLPVYDERPAGKSALLAELANLDDWKLETQRDPELEFYNFMIPRRQGDFAFEPIAEFEGRKQVLRVAPRPIKHGKDTMPMYAVLAHKKGIPVPGTPTEVGLWVNGNSAWGRLIYEFADASGQRWISLGAQQADMPNPWIADGIPKDLLALFPNPGIND